MTPTLFGLKTKTGRNIRGYCRFQRRFGWLFKIQNQRTVLQKPKTIAYVYIKAGPPFCFFVKLARLYPLKVRFPFDYFEHWLQPSAYLQFSPFQLFQQMLIFVEEWFFFTIILFIMPLAHDDNLADVMLSGFDSGDTD